MTYYEDAKILVYLTRLGELGIYRLDSKSTVKITERNAAEYVFLRRRLQDRRAESSRPETSRRLLCMTVGTQRVCVRL